jgi:hypothetical protein
MFKTVKLGSNIAKTYLGESVLVQKSLAKPLDSLQGERSQGTPAMVCHEEAGQRHSGGRRAGLTVVRASTPKVKHVSPASGSLPKSLIRLLSSANRVIGGVTWRKRPLTHTGEVPRRLCFFFRRVTPVYKVLPKCLAYAMVRRRPP